jgi:ferrochelatase
VVKLPRWLWLPILYGIVLRTRPKASAHKYEQIWLPEGSPLAVNTMRQAVLLQETLGMPVRYAMRYGQPFGRRRAYGLEGSRSVIPLYPQYAGEHRPTACATSCRLA